MKLSVVIPAYNEEGSIAQTVTAIAQRLDAESIEREIIVVDDGSTDSTGEIMQRLQSEDGGIRCVRNDGPNGFGFAVRFGLGLFTGDAVVIMMADLSDSPEDLVSYYRVLEDGYDCAFGSRFMPGANVSGYPMLKLTLNRAANAFIRALFGHGYNDTTNAFKGYRREVIETVQPLLSNHFNITVELPLKAIVRGHSYKIVPISWSDRTSGESKLRLQEMGSRYLYIVIVVWLEHHLSRGDYRRSEIAARLSHWHAGRPATGSVDPSQPRPPADGS
ncbi:MAG: glycosyltransferase family 2 protein [Solirubrobacterales bacterium]|nr:glycosyltransferase family 2 protein [Solirubrobacterales bacterium]